MTQADLLAFRKKLDMPAPELEKLIAKAAKNEREQAKEQLRKAVRKAQRETRPITPGNVNRQWLQCPKCGRLQHREYVPFSLSNPILVPACSHGFFNDLIPICTIEQRNGVAKLKWVWD
jgi:hypothetical protein